MQGGRGAQGKLLEKAVMALEKIGLRKEKKRHLFISKVQSRLCLSACTHLAHFADGCIFVYKLIKYESSRQCHIYHHGRIRNQFIRAKF